MRALVDALLARFRALPCDTDPRLWFLILAAVGRSMHLLNTVLVVLGAWLLLAVPVALAMGRFLRAGDRLATTGDRAAGNWFDSAA